MKNRDENRHVFLLPAVMEKDSVAVLHIQCCFFFDYIVNILT